MLELLFCSILTILPDFLFRRYVQGKRIGQEINLFSVWFELRWGITACAILTISLITTIFYYHPATTSVANYFRTVTILPEKGGRVSDVQVINNQMVKAGDVLFRLGDTSQRTAVATSQARIKEVEALQAVAATDLAAAEAGIDQVEASLKQANDDLARNLELKDRGSSAVRQTEIDRLQNLVGQREAQLDAAKASKAAVETNIGVLIPAQRASAIAALEQAEAELAKTIVYAGVTGRVEQFSLQVGDYVNPILRPAGLLIPDEFTERDRFAAGFSQLTANVIKPGMYAEMGCLSKPFTIIPMVVVGIQSVIPSGQMRPTDALRDPQDIGRPGTITVFLEPVYEGQAADILPGSTCLANAYTNNHEKLADPDLGTGEWLFLHMVDTVGIVHALLLRIQMLMLPVQNLVFSGH
ncbi:HlyD family secretion protein [Parasedimentitalea psychrophila]|uniref:Biotin/lipoyl-binding protein n=1 Tax=Parasedimentitalea psychrophila TaxID=2997337 RepID=A0A9Y2P5G8_9RHOB|nr:biotin/lipoyl-binding protein [Parasedimentitalea psychrophila]WIY26354.1 biotin/lipoyl-binding protein [Parasedimentitalea psychrophila]